MSSQNFNTMSSATRARCIIRFVRRAHTAGDMATLRQKKVAAVAVSAWVLKGSSLSRSGPHSRLGVELLGIRVSYLCCVQCTRLLTV